MTAVMIILLVQGVLGGADNLIHHELQAKLPARRSARRELALHAAREAIYGVIFLALAWTIPTGLWAWALTLLLTVEIGITAADFLEEDRTRLLPPAERVLHLVLAVGYGVFIAVLAPHLWTWLAQPTALEPAGYGLLSWAATLFSAGVLAWSIRNTIAVLGMGRTAVSQPVDEAHESMSRQTYLVTGGTGFIGSALVVNLANEGHRVFVLSRDPRQARAQFADCATVIDRLDDLPAETQIDAIVNLAGAPIFGLPWTKARRRVLADSRRAVTESLNRLIARLDRKPAVMVTASAVGFYGHGDDQPIDETAPAQPNFSSELCRSREEVAGRAEQLGVRCVFLRFGLVLGAGGGVLAPLALASRFGLGSILGDGRQPMPWIHTDDALGLIRFAIDNANLHGPVNATAPDTPRQVDFARTLASVVRRPIWLRVPAWILNAMLGEQAELLLRGRVVVPARAVQAGYRFRHRSIRSALEQSLGSGHRLAGRRDSAAMVEP